MSPKSPRRSTSIPIAHGVPVNELVLPDRHSLFPEPFQYGFLVNSGHVFRRTNAAVLRPGSRTVNAKIPIPRASHASSSSDRARAKHACNNCREHKAKCTGRQPCQRCEDTGVRCIYGIRKREEYDKHIGELSAQNQLYHDLIRDLYPRLDALSAQHVDKTLRDRLVQLGDSDAPPTEPSTRHNSCPFATKDHSEEDFNSSEQTQAMGFVGECSVTAWLYKLKRDFEWGDTPSRNDEPVLPALSSLNYFQDEAKVLALENSDPWARPSRETANHLVDFYFRAIHPEFPVIGKVTFRWQYRSYCSNPNVQPGKRWTAVLNLVFAIAAKYSSPVDGQSWGTPGDHELYFARAWHLSIGQAALVEHPDLQQVQVEGLAAFYLLLTGQVNRAWRMIGMAIRSALAMGLNLRNVADQIPYSSKEIRYRLWWALFIMDTVLQEITGRPPNTHATFCTTPLPIPYLEEDFSDDAVVHIITDISIRNTLVSSLLSFSGGNTYITSDASRNRGRPATFESEEGRLNGQATQTITEGVTPNASLYFLYTVELAQLMREVIETLYSPGLPPRSWLEMEVVISKLNDSIDRWLLRLPEEFNFTRRSKTRPFARQRISLGFRFYTAKMVICQPCLHHLAYTSPPSSSPRAMRSTMASMCVQAARQMLDLLPDEVDMTWFYGSTPWWCVLHHIMRSVTVLLVELFTRIEPGTSEASQLITLIQKALRWLQAMSIQDPSSRKAWLVCKEIISRHGSKFALVINDSF